MTIGATSGKEPDHVDDGDLLSLDEMRGAMKELNAAELTNRERATVRGLMDEVAALKKMCHETIENNNKLINLYQTFRNEFNQFKAMHAASLSLRLGGGSTTPEDYDGDNP